MTLADEYQARYENVLKPAAESLVRHVAENMQGLPRIDRITARAKSVESFSAKASQQADDGRQLYKLPLSEIQDQLGARIVVFYIDDVEPVTDRVRKYYNPIEIDHKEPSDPWKFGYSGVHLMLALPTEVIPEGFSENEAPGFFELQVKTLFQHAWSEADHDLGYKTTVDLSFDQKRQLAWTAAQAWGADRAFSELFRTTSTI